MPGFHEDEARRLLLAVLFAVVLALGMAALMPGPRAAESRALPNVSRGPAQASGLGLRRGAEVSVFLRKAQVFVGENV